jgi:CRISPR-associated exonuclease Cas4
MSNSELYWISPSIVLEYLFCPRFIYFMNCLNIPQREEKRYLVQKGRDIHDRKIEENKDYLRKKLRVIKKLSDVNLYSNEYKINGKVDEILFLEDGSIIPLDYKYAFNEKNFKTYFFQSLMYCLMIEENFNYKSRRGIVCYTRDKYLTKEIIFCDKDIEKLKEILDDIININITGLMPKKKASSAKCADCTYRKLCV